MADAMVDEFSDLNDLALGEELIPELPIYTQVQAWDVITAYFDEKGLVRQQLDSFDQVGSWSYVDWRFVSQSYKTLFLISRPLSCCSSCQFLLNTIAEVLEDTAPIQVKPQPQYVPGAQTSEVCGHRCIPHRPLPIIPLKLSPFFVAPI
jgi:hypothetical protein